MMRLLVYTKVFFDKCIQLADYVAGIIASRKKLQRYPEFKFPKNIKLIENPDISVLLRK